MKAIFIGAVEFSRSTLEQLLTTDIEIAGVCTLAASSFNADYCDLAPICRQRGIPWQYVDDVNSPQSLDWMRARQPDVVFCFGWSRLLRESLLKLAPLGVVGFHPAALPANRGRHPIIWALALGLDSTASTFFFMNHEVDGGDILSQRPISIGDDDDAGTLYARITACALEQIDEFVPRLIDGTFQRREQDASRANVWRKRGKDDGRIDWRMSARNVHNLVRALTRPYVGAHFTRAAESVKVWGARVVAGTPPNCEPGKVLSVEPGGALIACGSDGILLTQTEPAIHLRVGEYL
jgi:methionyl-tRNA formyltransferase